MNKGIKYDSDKIRYDLVKPEMLEELAKVLDYGARKYNDDNWRLVEPRRYIAALFRHLQSHRKGKLRDEETGYLHLSHALACIAILVQKQIEEDALTESPPPLPLTDDDYNNMLKDTIFKSRSYTNAEDNLEILDTDYLGNHTITIVKK